MGDSPRQMSIPKMEKFLPILVGRRRLVGLRKSAVALITEIISGISIRHAGEACAGPGPVAGIQVLKTLDPGMRRDRDDDQGMNQPFTREPKE